MIVMKKTIMICLITALVAGGILAGTIITTAQSAPEYTPYPVDQEQYESVEAAKAAVYTKIGEAEEDHMQQLMDEGLPGVDKDSPFYSSELTFEAQSRAFVDFAKELLEMMKYYGDIPANRELEDFYNDEGKDRELYYDYIIECCRVYSDPELPLTNYDKAMLEVFFNNAYAPLESEEWVPANEGKFESVRAKRDAAMTALEGVGVEPSMNRKRLLGLI